MGVEKYLKQFKDRLGTETRYENQGFGLVFADPPYEKHPGVELLKELLTPGILASGATIVVEAEKATYMPELVVHDANSQDGLIQEQYRSYGATSCYFYRKT
jgi:16S rRNA G966 N2-methylase RsmD